MTIGKVEAYAVRISRKLARVTGTVGSPARLLDPDAIFELLPFLRARAVDLLQPDTGRTGITEGRKIATLAGTFHIRLAPHVSIALGPQITAALHLATAIPNLEIVECNPKVFQIANKFVLTPLTFSPSAITVPDGPASASRSMKRR